MRTNMIDTGIVIKNVVKKFDDVTAVDNISLNISEGEVFGLLGPNGAGKTTIINILCGLLKPTSGFVSVGGYDMQKELENVRKFIGVCPQETVVYPYLTGEENIQLFGELHTMNKDLLKARKKLLLTKLGLYEASRKKAEKYSGGMKRRLSLILALVHDPKIVFLDEPTVALDAQSRHAVWDFIKELKENSKTIILTTHYMEEAEELCDRIGIIDYGKLIALGSPDNLIREYDAKNLEEVFIKLTSRRIREEI
ncbi:MAG: ATP-binding cassette domain-containing protein [Nitrososphaeria archaeon]|nr:ATP-binding cassette domain-containing protein [Nitrososphaeria archaeon]